MGPKHSRDGILRGALDVADEHGLGRLSFGRVAARLGVSDRTVVYYFPTREALATEVVTVLGGRLQEALATVVDGPAGDHAELVRRLWPALAHPGTDRTFALFFEAIGLASAGQAPYDALAPTLLEGWIAWAAERLDGPADRRRREAEATVALADGLLLLRQVAGPGAADGAARALGVA